MHQHLSVKAVLECSTLFHMIPTTSDYPAVCVLLWKTVMDSYCGQLRSVFTVNVYVFIIFCVFELVCLIVPVF